MAQVKSKTGFRGPESARIATQWKPGQSGNPGGRPKMRAYSQACREIGQLPMSEIQQIVSDPESTGIEVVTAQQIIKAAKGFSASAVWVADRAEGKPSQPIDMRTQITEGTARDIIDVYNDCFRDTPSTFASPDIRPLKPIQNEQVTEVRMMTAAEVALDTRELVQRHQDEERARQLMHQGKPFPAL